MGFNSQRCLLCMFPVNELEYFKLEYYSVENSFFFLVLMTINDNGGGMERKKVPGVTTKIDKNKDEKLERIEVKVKQYSSGVWPYL